MHRDSLEYIHFCTRQNLHKSIETISGLFQGITIDKKLTDGEIAFLNSWTIEHQKAALRHPYNELLPVIRDALEDSIITQDERDDILWLCEKFSKQKGAYSETTAGIQQLHGILGGIIADAEITKEELLGLQAWLEDHSHLKTIWPYDEVDALITDVLADGIIDEEEHHMLLSFFAEFIPLEDDKTITNPLAKIGSTISGICACQPEILFNNKNFCFTGAFSANVIRDEASQWVISQGGSVAKNVSKKTDYLVIGSDGNPCWAYACYGRKVEKAVNLRKEGHSLTLIHESDFRDAIADRV